MLSTLRNLWTRRALVRELARFELASALSRSKLGWLWWLLDPLVMMGIYWVFIVIIFGRDKYPAYPVFVGCALLPWKFFSTCTFRSVNLLRSKETLIKSIPFPTMALPISTVFAQLVFLAFGMIALLGVALVFGLPITGYVVQIIPVTLLLLMLVTGIALAMSTIGVLTRDVGTFVGHVLRIGWYLSPGIYGLDMVVDRVDQSGWPGWIPTVYMLNPFACVFEGYRAALHDPHWMDGTYWLTLGVESVLMLAAGLIMYHAFDRRMVKLI